MNKKIIKRIYNVVIILCFIGAIGWCFSHFYHGSDVVYTDDAQVNRHITPINTRVSGFIKEIRFSDYQHVKKGDTLVIIEDSEFRLHVAQAEAGLRGSKAGSSVVSASMGTTTTNVQTASAGIEEARVDMMNAKQDFDRFAALMKKDAVTRQQYDNAYARYLGAKARYEQASSRKASAASVRNVQTYQLGGSRAGESVAEAQLNLARLNLSYTVIVATCDGVMGRKDIHEGQLVQPGQMLARIVDDNDVWVVANYRETQMDGIQVGKAVDFTADAIPLPLQDEVPFYQPPASAECGVGSGGLQFSHHVDRFGSRDVHSRLHRRFLQTLRHLRMYEYHPAMDDLQARFYHLLPPALLHRAGKYVPLALGYRTPYLYISGLAHHQLDDDRRPAAGSTHRVCHHPRLPLHEAPALYQSRLSGLHSLVGMDAGVHLLLHLRRALQLARFEDYADGCSTLYFYRLFLHPAHASHPSPLHRPSSMEV